MKYSGVWFFTGLSDIKISQELKITDNKKPPKHFSSGGSYFICKQD